MLEKLLFDLSSYVWLENLQPGGNLAWPMNLLHLFSNEAQFNLFAHLFTILFLLLN